MKISRVVDNGERRGTQSPANQMSIYKANLDAITNAIKSSFFAAIIFALFALTCSSALVTEKTKGYIGKSSPATIDKPISATKGIAFLANKRIQRSVYGLGPKMLAISHSKIPIELDLLVDDLNEDGDERDKRYDDYGHMRFGKRGGGKFDDYGHMRFGRSV